MKLVGYVTSILFYDYKPCGKKLKILEIYFRGNCYFISALSLQFS